jgi:hypothetical protein
MTVPERTDHLDASNPFARALMPRPCSDDNCPIHGANLLDPASFPLPYFSDAGYYITPNVCLACHAEAEVNRRAAAKESTCPAP